MLAERTVRRLSIRAPADALARHAGFLIEDALRTASLPGDGAEVLLLRRLRLPPFAGGASPQQVALQLESACRAAIAVDGVVADDAALAAAPAVRFADTLTAHLVLTRAILAGVSRQAWCWPMVVKGYRPALGRGAVLRIVALSLADLPEAPAALPRFIALLVAHGGNACAALLLALSGDDAARLQHACSGALKQALADAPARWRSVLDWSSACLGVGDVRHRWLLGMATACGVHGDRPARRDPDVAEAPQALCQAAPAERVSEVGGGDDERTATGLEAALSAQSPAPAGPLVTPPAGARETGQRAVTPRSSAAKRQSVTRAAPRRPSAPRRQVVRAATDVLSADASDELPAVVDCRVAQIDIAAATAAGGVLFLVPLLTRLGLADFLCEDAARSDLPRRIFATLLLRLLIADDDPVWILCGPARLIDHVADREAGRWLTRCRSHLRLHVGIGLHSLVCRPATLAITATHVDVRLAIDAVDLRVRRAGLDIDPGWVPWLGRVLRFHYGRVRS